MDANESLQTHLLKSILRTVQRLVFYSTLSTRYKESPRYAETVRGKQENCVITVGLPTPLASILPAHPSHGGSAARSVYKHHTVGRKHVEMD